MKGKIWIPACAGMMLLLSGLYYYQGSGHQVLQAYKKAQQEEKAEKVLKSLHNDTHAIINAMQAAIAKAHSNHKKARGWFLLSRLYAASHDNQKALEAINNAYQLEPTHFQYKLGYLEQLYTVNQGQHTPEIDDLIIKIQQKKPIPPAALDFLGYDAYMHQDYAGAVQYWEELLPYLANDAKLRESILKAIGKAQQKLVK